MKHPRLACHRLGLCTPSHSRESGMNWAQRAPVPPCALGPAPGLANPTPGAHLGPQAARTPTLLPHSTPPPLGAGEHGAAVLVRVGRAGGPLAAACPASVPLQGLPSLSLRVSFCAFCSMGVPLARVWTPRGPAWDHFPFLRSWGTKATPRFRFRGCGGGKKLSEAWPAAVGGFRPAVRTRPWKLSQRPPGVGGGVACWASMLPKGSPRGRAVSRWF